MKDFMKSKTTNAYLIAEKQGADKSVSHKPLAGFSKFSKLEKIDYLIKNHFYGSNEMKKTLMSFWAQNPEDQKLMDEFSENTISNFHFPLGVCPNVLINNKLFMVPMVIEESSVVAACAKAAKFWFDRGGFKTRVVGTEKIGQVHFIWNGETQKLKNFFESKKDHFIRELLPLMEKMIERGGGLKNLELKDLTDKEPGYFQLWASFDTCDAMGANFINTILEMLAKLLKEGLMVEDSLNDSEREVQIVMSILSNYTPECRVIAEVECSIDELNEEGLGMEAIEFAEKFARAVRISKIDINRATTHNKGIFNGIDAVVLATGNDFRAIEACGHTWASRDGQYRGLTDISLKNGRFKFSLEIPLSVGTVGGLTGLHPMAKFSLDLLGKPSAEKLMEVLAVIGLAQNFAALKSLTTSGIQKGHMKMHLMNILKHLEANEIEVSKAKEYFENNVISYSGVREFLNTQRKYQ
jgi:hydroxymethylglutaryl-CoA reductase